MHRTWRRHGAVWLALLMVASGFSLLAPASAQTEEPGDDWVQTRLQMVHRPNQSTVPQELGDAASDARFLPDRGIYVNEVSDNEVEDRLGDGLSYPEHPNAAVRLYGEEGQIAPRQFSSPLDAYDPTVIPKDSATWNPAIIRHTDDASKVLVKGVFGTNADQTEGPDGLIGPRACGQDAHVKKHLRHWYEPEHEYHGPRVDAEHYTPATFADVIQVESTYELLDASSYRPTGGCEEITEFPFPTEGVWLDEDFEPVAHKQPGLDSLTMVRVSEVEGLHTVQGTISIERQVTLDYEGQIIQFLDHQLRFKGLVEDLEGDIQAQASIEYIGNTFPDAQRNINIRDKTFYTRFNSESATPVHKDPSNTATWYTKLDSFDNTGGDESATLTVGKRLMTGDIFYTDGVRYEIVAIHVDDNGDFRSITLRTPLPKSDPGGSWASVTDPTRENKVDGQWQVQDNSVVTTQWLHEFDWAHPIPVDPPFNHNYYNMVDDIDVQLWEPGDNIPDEKEDRFPWGPPNEAVPEGNGMPMFPLGERYLTMMNPPQEWIDYFEAEPTGLLDDVSDGSYADSIPDRIDSEPGINHNAWYNSGTTGTPSFKDNTINFFWLEEWYEDRYSTNLLQILKENLTATKLVDQEFFTKYEIASHPDRYTEFVLPERDDPANLLDAFGDGVSADQERANLEFAEPCTRMDVIKGSPGTQAPGPTDTTPCLKDRWELLQGDYLITTSLRLQDGETRHKFAHDPDVEMFPDKFWDDIDGLDDIDLYFNEIDIPGMFSNIRPDVADTTVRLFGEEGAANHAPDVFEEYWHAFDPYTIPKDSATFNPALVRNLDPQDANTQFDIKACGENAHVKKHLRLWYEPGHDYHGPRVDDPVKMYTPTVGDVIQVESTYMLLDASNYHPTHGCENNTRLPFPTDGVHLRQNDGHEQPGLDNLTTVDIGAISGGTGVNGTIEVMQKTEFEIGETVQFLDHMVRFNGLVEGTDSGEIEAQLDVWYIGNTFADAQQQIDVRDRVYLTRSNAQHDTPLHNASMNMRTWFVELNNFDNVGGDEVATLTIGKELSRGDVFYADGVRYEIPAIHVVDDQFKYITLRTPIPKSDPGSGTEECEATACKGTEGSASWTSITDVTREELIDGQFQVQDNSQVTTQWLVEVDHKDPIPVDPPFNLGNYTMVDDTDVQLWEPGEDLTQERKDTFPWGLPEDSLPDGETGKVAFPEGERYLTAMNPPQEWLDYFEAEPTGYLDEGNDYASSLPQRTALAPGINTGAWENSSFTGPHVFKEKNVTFFWAKEWHEGRYSTNLLELPNGSEFDKDEVATLPDRYTAFVLPDRPNPVSATNGTLHWGDDGDEGVILGPGQCTRLDLDDEGGANCNDNIALLGGDYLITTSLLLETCGCEDPIVPPPDDGDTGDSSTTTHSYDANEDCVFSDDEVLSLVADWGKGLADDDTLLSGVAAWGQAPGTYC